MVVIGEYILMTHKKVEVPRNNISLFLKWTKDMISNEKNVPGSKLYSNYISTFNAKLNEITNTLFDTEQDLLNHLGGA